MSENQNKHDLEGVTTIVVHLRGGDAKFVSELKEDVDADEVRRVIEDALELDEVEYVSAVRE